MIPSGVEIFLLAPIDLRWGFDRLAGLVDEQIGRAARSGALFVFFGKRRGALKILFFDGGGLCLFYKRLVRGNFCLPEAVSGDTSVLIDARELALILQGVEPATRKQRVKMLVKRSRERALRISGSATAESPA